MSPSCGQYTMLLLLGVLTQGHTISGYSVQNLNVSSYISHTNSDVTRFIASNCFIKKTTAANVWFAMMTLINLCLMHLVQNIFGLFSVNPLQISMQIPTKDRKPVTMTNWLAFTKCKCISYCWKSLDIIKISSFIRFKQSIYSVFCKSHMWILPASTAAKLFASCICRALSLFVSMMLCLKSSWDEAVFHLVWANTG